MAETLRARVGRIIAGSVHAVLDKIEDQAPEAVMEQAIREVQEAIDEVRTELGTTTANRHLAQQQHADLNTKHTELSASIEHALAEKRDDLARAAVARQLDIEAQLPILESTLADLSRQEQELGGYVDALLGKKNEMNAAVEAYRASRAKAGSMANTVSASATSRGKLDQATAAFDKVYARQTGLSPASRGATLDQAVKITELDELVRKNKIEERLAQLKVSKQG